MANIMVTDVCNLHCPYCFANEFVNKSKNEISLEAFQKAVDFIVRDNAHKTVGIIGGEPTVHSQFELLMQTLIKDTRVERVMLYTNGVLLDRFWDVCCHAKVAMLINCNAPSFIGDKAYQRTVENLDTLFNQKLCRERVTLGINLYQPDFQYDYMIELLERYDLHKVRVSVTVPNMDDQRNINAHAYFLSMKPQLLAFFHALLSRDIIPHFDCNKIPSCLLTEEELRGFDRYLQSDYIKAHIGDSNIADTRVVCSPVVDIRQDLTAVRCFGLSDSTKQPIEAFHDLTELEKFYTGTVDAFAYNTVYEKACTDCHLRKVLKCTGGCLAFKINAINALQQAAQRKMEAVND